MSNKLIRRHFIRFHFKDGTQADFEIESPTMGNVIIHSLAVRPGCDKLFFEFEFGRHENGIERGAVEVANLLYASTDTITVSVAEDV